MKRVSLIVLCLLSGLWSCKPAYQRENLSFQERAEDLVSRMTLKEKVSQMTHESSAIERLGVPEYN